LQAWKMAAKVLMFVVASVVFITSGLYHELLRHVDQLTDTCMD